MSTDMTPSAHPDPDAPDSDAAGSVDPTHAAMHESMMPVGAILARARREVDVDVAVIAHQLAIKARHIEAIEEGRFEDLPGRTYAVGYVRAYAKFLGFDGEWAVNRFRREAEGLDAAPKLEFKSPLPESRLPGGAIMFLSVLLSVFAYGGWYYLSSTDQTIADLVPEVPERLAVLVDSDDGIDAAVTAPAETPATEAAEGVAVAPVPVAPVPVGSVPVGSVPVAPVPVDPETVTPVVVARDAPVDQADADQAALEAEVGGTAASQAIAAISPNDEPPIPTQTPEARLSTASEPPASVPAVEAAPTATVPATETQVAALPAAPPAIPTAPAVSDDLAPINRVVLKARDEVWIQVREGETAVVTRIMKSGDVYRVPNRDGLTLLTGSAGALDVIVDGTLVPALGPLGAVRRDISLDPASLLARQAGTLQ
ncbi:MAG: DUF4115 domain-containing protein [Alphaproteobacteria bacterium]|nr:DUF4115 domain-containing protein [Alphaproteobacteria bacterium]